MKQTLQELKAMAYDLIAQKEYVINQLRQINQAIANYKEEYPKKEPKKDIKKEK